MAAITEHDGLTRFDEGMRAFRTAMEAAPPEALAYLRPDDDYSLGGLIFHVNVILDHYARVLAAIQEADFGESRPSDPPGLMEEANRLARQPGSADELKVQLVRMDGLHAAARGLLLDMSEAFERKAPVFFNDATDAYPTSPADVAGWLTGHYLEHIPHAWELVSEWTTLQVIGAFNSAVNSHDVDAIMALMTDDCVFENRGPAPDGSRHEGSAAVRKVWEEHFAATPSAQFETEEAIATGTRAITRWRYTWEGGHVRGADIARVRDGKVAEVLSYLKA